MKLIIIALVTAVLLTGCNENVLAKNYGGTVTIHLPAGKKLVNATWKDAEIWYLYRPARPGESFEEVVLKEKSMYGIHEGTVIFREAP